MYTEKLHSKSRDKIWLTMIGSACKSLPSLLHALTHFGEANEAASTPANPPSPWRKKRQRGQQGKGSSEQVNISYTAAVQQTLLWSLPWPRGSPWGSSVQASQWVTPRYCRMSCKEIQKQRTKPQTASAVTHQLQHHLNMATIRMVLGTYAASKL